MHDQFEVGDPVQWHWGEGVGTGEVIERFTTKTTVTIKGTNVTREASEDKPAYLLEQEDGGRVLKSISEIDPQ